MRHGRDESQEARPERRRGGPARQGFGLLPEIGASVRSQRLQDDREQTGLLHIDGSIRKGHEDMSHYVHFKGKM